MKQQLQNYKALILSENKKYDPIVSKLREQFTTEVLRQAQRKFEQHLQLFQKHRKRFDRELQQLDYYFDNDKPKNNCKIASVFSQIDDKLLFNFDYLQSLEVSFSYPLGADGKSIDDCQGKMLIYENCFDAIRKIVYGSPQLAKYCKKETEEIQNYIRKCRKLITEFRLNQWKISKERNFKGSVEDICNMLAESQYSESLKILVKTDKGVMSKQQYTKLADYIYLNKVHLKELKLGLSDMQFYQQKCDILKRRLTKMPILTEVQISNYYGECKLGNFMDFNWYPYKKKSNITVSKLS